MIASYGNCLIKTVGLKVEVEDLKEKVLYLQAELKRQEQRYHASLATLLVAYPTTML